MFDEQSDSNNDQSESEKEPLKQRIWRKFTRTASMSLILSAIAAVVGIIYSLVVDGSVLTSYIINAGIITGALVLAAGWLVFALPLPKTGGDYTRRHFLQRRPFVLSPKQKGIELLDHSNFEKYMKAREMKRNHAYDILYVGLGVFLLVGIAEIIVWRLTN